MISEVDNCPAAPRSVGRGGVAVGSLSAAECWFPPSPPPVRRGHIHLALPPLEVQIVVDFSVSLSGSNPSLPALFLLFHGSAGYSLFLLAAPIPPQLYFSLPLLSLPPSPLFPGVCTHSLTERVKNC